MYRSCQMPRASQSTGGWEGAPLSQDCLGRQREQHPTQGLPQSEGVCSRKHRPLATDWEASPA